MQFEVLIADDGSTEGTLKKVRQYITECSFSVRLIWQADSGFRAAKIRNQAAAQAKGSYLVFLDGDSVPRPDFIERHRTLAETGYWVSGNRILLSRRFTRKVLAEEAVFLKHSVGYWWLQRLVGNINRCLPVIYWPFSLWRKSQPKAWKEAQIYNLGVWKRDFLLVNGFDERYAGWGYEDSDFAIRLIHAKRFRKSGAFALPVFHLWHKKVMHPLEAKNLARLQSVIDGGHSEAVLGVSQYNLRLYPEQVTDEKLCEGEKTGSEREQA
eukprot:TRINITY_DN24871_c0_g1_i1.p1 TRINITY_DN24871_c0_g1~~TRINITY_DN24871_c0_g1_i1.p1  ORF type:complete len:268 (+),score=-54.06 TRINITY_DN24871_c0_g1_i1:379-1182(+)